MGSAIQTLAMIFTGGRNKKGHLKFLENPAAINLVNDLELKKDIEVELARDRKAKPARLPSRIDDDEFQDLPDEEKKKKKHKTKESKGELMFELLSGVVKDHVDHKRLRELFENGLDEQYRDRVKYQISRMFTFKAISDVFDGDLSKVKFKQVKSTKRMPAWWNPELDLFLSQGCYTHGWGNYNGDLAERDSFRVLIKDIPSTKKRKSPRSRKKKNVKKKEPAKEEKEPTFEDKLKLVKWIHGPLQIDRL